ncbi:FimV/HubP family polar landmark protein, partial [Algicola sagamiensis]|uniref:FimV/HubP family polar landmark protein n=1 Tax=Algicola sagamiensis TaxID=163869 RepID=UPI00058BF2C8
MGRIGVVLSAIIFTTILASAHLVAEEQKIQLRGPKGTDHLQRGKNFGPIDETHTLWSIAKSTRPNTRVTVYQMMVALFKKNPHAFADNNLNHIKVGSMLVIPSLDEINQINPEEARLRADEDESDWSSIVHGKGVPAKSIEKRTKSKSAKVADIENVKKEIKTKLVDIKENQKARFDEIKDKVVDAAGTVKAIKDENEQLKGQLKDVTDKITDIDKRLDEGTEEFDKIKDATKEILEKQEKQIALQEEELNTAFNQFKKLASENLAVQIALGVVPALIAILMLVFFLKRRKRQEEEPEFAMPEAAPAVAEKSMPLEPDMPEDDFDMGIGDSAEDDLADDSDAIQLDVDDGFDLGEDSLDLPEDDSLDDLLEEESFEDDTLDDLLDGDDDLGSLEEDSVDLVPEMDSDSDSLEDDSPEEIMVETNIDDLMEEGDHDLAGDGDLAQDLDEIELDLDASDEESLDVDLDSALSEDDASVDESSDLDLDELLSEGGESDLAPDEEELVVELESDADDDLDASLVEDISEISLEEA